MPPELPASALYSSPSLGRLWKKVHLAYSPFLRRPSVRRLYQKPAPRLLKLLPGPYSLIALGCADGTKEALLLKKLPKPAYVLAADTNLSLARRASRRLPAGKKTCLKIDLSRFLSAFNFFPPKIKNQKSKIRENHHPRLFTLFGVLPNLDPLPLLRRLSRRMQRGDFLLFSANLAPGKSGWTGARKVLPQYDNLPTRRWLESAIHRFRPKLPQGRLEFGVHPDPLQNSLARIEARWIVGKKAWIIFSSRRPTVPQVEAWISKSGFKKVAHFLDPRGEEGLWLVRLGKT